MAVRFGTDGIRGVANLDVTVELAVAMGRAAARLLGGERLLVGRDTRRSGPLLEAALAAGAAAEGVDVVLMGVVPTPAVAWASVDENVPAVMLSASHNPFSDNGVKLFAAGGRKLADDTERAFEAELDCLLADDRPERTPPVGAAVGAIGPGADRLLGYAGSVVSSIEGRDLGGLRLVVDCANGAATTVAPHVLRRLGAEVTVIHGEPDGTNINDGCGSTYPSDLQRAVVEAGADAGLAFDGDADRVVAVDHAGTVVDGDQLVAVCALDRHQRGALAGATVVVTVMSNLGLRLAMAEHGIAVVETAVGDRNVLQALESGGFEVGGEQSGHIIFRDLATTGDGLLTAVQLLDVVARSGSRVAELASVVHRLPQVLRNVAVAAPVTAVEMAERLGPDIAAAAAELGERGRVLVRPSGTEPLLRVMVEAPTEAQAQAVADRLATAASR